MTCLYFVLQTYLINFEICMLICHLTGDKFNHWTWFREDTSLNTSSHISYSLFGSKTKPEVQESIRTHFGLVTRVANHINDGSVPWRCDSVPACTTPGPANWSSYMEFSCNDLIVNTCAFTQQWHDTVSPMKKSICVEEQMSVRYLELRGHNTPSQGCTHNSSHSLRVKFFQTSY